MWHIYICFILLFILFIYLVRALVVFVFFLTYFYFYLSCHSPSFCFVLFWRIPTYLDLFLKHLLSTIILESLKQVKNEMNQPKNINTLFPTEKSKLFSVVY